MEFDFVAIDLVRAFGYFCDNLQKAKRCRVAFEEWAVRVYWLTHSNHNVTSKRCFICLVVFIIYVMSRFAVFNIWFHFRFIFSWFFFKNIFCLFSFSFYSLIVILLSFVVNIFLFRVCFCSFFEICMSWALFKWPHQRLFCLRFKCIKVAHTATTTINFFSYSWRCIFTQFQWNSGRRRRRQRQ